MHRPQGIIVKRRHLSLTPFIQAAFGDGRRKALQASFYH